MKVLMAVQQNIGNSYLRDIAKHMVSIKIQYDSKNFFDLTNDFDIIHIHWPEDLLNRKTPKTQDLEMLTSIFEQWKEKNTKIVLTMHNEKSHSNNPNKNELYKIVYSFADGVIHLGNHSFNKAKDKNKKKHVIIPHSLYENLPNNITKTQSRNILGIPKRKMLVACFGEIRNNDEYNLILQSFKKLKLKNKSLLIPKYPTLYSWKSSPIKRFNSELFYLKSKLLKINYLYKLKFINNKDIQLYLNAADILLIPRCDALNSGNLLLGYTFGKIVVGPDIGNIGHILKETKNPTFNPKSLESINRAIESGIELSRTNFGNNNYQYGLNNWNLIKTASKHIKLYKELIL